MAETKTQLVQRFIFSINEDIKHYKQLLHLLQDQSALYLKFDGEALSENIHQQLPILKQLGRSAAERSRCLQQLHLPSSELGVEKLIHALPDKHKVPLKKQWKSLETLIKHCQKYNNQNGQSSAAFHELLGQLTQQPQHAYGENQF